MSALSPPSWVAAAWMEAPSTGVSTMWASTGAGKDLPLMVTFSMTGSSQLSARTDLSTSSMETLRSTRPVIGTSSKASMKMPYWPPALVRFSMVMLRK